MSDLIKREDAIKAYNEAMEELVKWQMEEWQLGDFSECEFNTTDCKHIVRKLEAIPSADRPQGEWIDKGWKGDWQFETDGRGNCWHEYECSECGFRNKGSKSKFCPDCGRRMKGADDECSDR